MRESSPHRHTGVVDMREVVCLLGLGVLLVLVDANLQVSEKTCGQVKCKPMQFCEPHKNTCDPCSEVCDRESHNYQEDVCEQQCQDYIHFQQFVTREETMGGEDINSKVARLTVLVTATLVLVVLLLLAMVAAFLIFYWHRRRQLLSPPDYSKSPPSPGAAEHGKMNGLKIEMPPPPPPSTTTAPPPITPATTSTPLSTRPRYPKEDPTLEYGAYDNPALTPSPVFENNKDSTPTATTTPVSRRQESSF